MIKKSILFVWCLLSCLALWSQPLTNGIKDKTKETGISKAKVAPPKPVLPIPSAKQLAWQDLGQYAFVHFTTNTFTGKEWGYGDEDPSIFNPTNIDVEQWARTIKNAGLKGIVLTCKHHDGFCLWPSKYTDHSVKSSKWMDGKGDIVRMVSDACKKQGLKFGVYLSPWDRNRSDYGTPTYIEYYRNQLKELYTQYGPIFEMWFDGANGGDGYYGGAKEKRKIDASTYYQWPTTLKMILALQPNVSFFSDAGPDIRWCGNESGYIGETNWSPITKDTIYAGKSGISDLLNHGEENGKHWIPAEVDVSIRPGWFYHAEEDSKVKTPEQLFDIYLNSVGRGANLILNIPPDRRGLLHENDVKSLLGWKKLIDESFKTDLALNCKVTASNTRGNDRDYQADNLTDSNNSNYWSADDQVTSAKLEVTLKKPSIVKFIAIEEFIALGQRIKKFEIAAWKENKWLEIAKGTTIGHKRILKVNPIETEKIQIRILDSKETPVLKKISIY